MRFTLARSCSGRSVSGLFTPAPFSHVVWKRETRLKRVSDVKPETWNAREARSTNLRQDKNKNGLSGECGVCESPWLTATQPGALLQKYRSLETF